MRILGTLAILAIFICGYGVFWFFSNRWYRRVIRNPRMTYTKDKFASDLRDNDYLDKAISDAFEDVARLCRHPAFPSDSLEKDLRCLPEDIEDMVEDRCRKTGFEDALRSPGSTALPIRTVEDYVRFLTALYGSTP